MRQFRNLLNYALGCIQRYKLRTLVILIGLGVAASTFSSVAFMSDGLAKEGALSLKYAPDLTVQGICSWKTNTHPYKLREFCSGQRSWSKWSFTKDLGIWKRWKYANSNCRH